MKRAIAILVLLALVCSTPPGLRALDCGVATTCDCGCDGAMKCCVSESDSSPANLPAAPMPSSAPKDFQLLSILPQEPWHWFAAPVSRVSPQIVSVPLAVAIPIFARDCAFLI